MRLRNPSQTHIQQSRSRDTGPTSHKTHHVLYHHLRPFYPIKCGLGVSMTTPKPSLEESIAKPPQTSMKIKNFAVNPLCGCDHSLLPAQHSLFTCSSTQRLPTVQTHRVQVHSKQCRRLTQTNSIRTSAIGIQFLAQLSFAKYSFNL